MCQKNVDFQNHLKTVLGEYGIDFSVVKILEERLCKGIFFGGAMGCIKWF